MAVWDMLKSLAKREKLSEVWFGIALIIFLFADLWICAFDLWQESLRAKERQV